MRWTVGVVCPFGRIGRVVGLDAKWTRDASGGMTCEWVVDDPMPLVGALVKLEIEGLAIWVHPFLD